MNKKKLHKQESEIEIVYPGDWIQFIIPGEKEFKIVIGRILGITANLELDVGTHMYTHWDKKEHWWKTRVPIEFVIKKYPHFGVVPIPYESKEAKKDLE